MRLSHGRLFLLSMGLVACRQDVARLDDVQKMAYGVKPAVVRVNAYATAEFQYSTTTINQVAADIGIAQTLDEANLAIPTGAGGSGTGFIINAAGWILTSGHVVAPTRDAVALRHDLLRNGAIAALLKHLPVDELRRLHREDGLERYVSTLTAAGRLANAQIVNEVELSNGSKHAFKIERYSPALNERGNDLALLRI